MRQTRRTIEELISTALACIGLNEGSIRYCIANDLGHHGHDDDGELVGDFDFGGGGALSCLSRHYLSPSRHIFRSLGGVSRHIRELSFLPFPPNLSPAALRLHLHHACRHAAACCPLPAACRHPINNPNLCLPYYVAIDEVDDDGDWYAAPVLVADAVL